MSVPNQMCHDAERGTNVTGDAVLPAQRSLAPTALSLPAVVQQLGAGSEILEVRDGPDTQTHCCLLAMTEQSQGPVPSAELYLGPTSSVRAMVVSVQLF